MKKKGQAGAMVMLAVGVIIMVIILGVIFQFLDDTALTSQTTSESVTTILEAQTQLGNADIIASTLTVDNLSSAAIGAGNYTLIAATGLINVSNQTGEAWPYFSSNGTSGTLRYNYSYFPEGYIDNSITRLIIANIPVLLGLVALLFIFAFVVIKGRQE